MVERGKRGNINGECNFNYCRRRVRVVVTFAISVSLEFFVQFVACMLDCTVLDSHSRLLRCFSLACVCCAKVKIMYQYL